MLWRMKSSNSTMLLKILYFNINFPNVIVWLQTWFYLSNYKYYFCKYNTFQTDSSVSRVNWDETGHPSFSIK